MTCKPALLFLTALLFCLPFVSIAQKNFVKGYFVTSQQDTIRCLINDRNWQKNPKEIQYKITDGGEIATFRPSQIKSFGVASGDVYVGELVTMDASSKNIEQLRTGRGEGSVTDTVFLRVLVRGAANLLYLNQGDRAYFYYQTGAGQPQELIVKYSLEEYQLSGKTLLVQENNFQVQLANFFQDCPAISQEVGKTQYSIQDLRAVFRQYNACRKDESYTTQAEKTQLSFGLVGGAAFRKASFNSAVSENLRHTTFKQPVSPILGVALNAVLPRDRQKWSFYNELAWKPYSGKGHYTQHFPFTYTHRNFYTEYSVNTVGLTSMIRYQFISGTVARPFVGIGITNTLTVDMQESQRVHVTYDFTNQQEHYEQVPFGGYSKYAVGGALGAGVAFKKATLELRADIGNGFTDIQFATSTISTFSFLLSYFPF